MISICSKILISFLSNDEPLTIQNCSTYVTNEELRIESKYAVGVLFLPLPFDLV